MPGSRLGIGGLGGSGSDSMSYARYDWWGYVRAVVRKYPSLRKDLEDLHTQSLAIDYSGLPRGSGAGRAVEALVIRELPSCKQREYEAVCAAIRDTERMENGSDRLKVADWVHWKRSLTISGAALRVPCSYKTAQRWQADFVKRVAAYLGFFDD